MARQTIVSTQQAERITDRALRHIRPIFGKCYGYPYQIRQAGLFVDADKFVWPREIDPGSWCEFRPNDSTADRPFVHISPLEIANAARFIQTKQEDLNEDELAVAVLQTFGRKRRTKQIAAHLAKTISRLAAAPA